MSYLTLAITPIALPLLLGAAPVPQQAISQTVPAKTASKAEPAKPQATPTPTPAPHRAKKRRIVRSEPARVAAANAAAVREPERQNYVNATQLYAYSEGAIYQLYAAPERVTDIALQPGEALVAVAAGDTARWVIGDTTSGSGVERRTHVLVKPFASGLSTNLIITTDRRTYHLALSSTKGAAMASLAWTYPQDALIALRRATAEAEAQAPVAEGLTLERLHFDYTIAGDKPGWRPLRAFDDGRQTFIEFPENLGVGEAPPLFVIGDEGAAQLVNYRVQGRFYVVDRLFDRAELRMGTKKQKVVRIVRGGASRGHR